MNSTASFTSLFEKHKEKVYRDVYSMTRSEWHAEEIVQDVFLRVWIHRDKIAAIKDIESWLYIITKRFVFDYIRKQVRQRKHFTTYKWPAAVSSSLSDGLLPLQCQRILDEALKQLSPREQQVYYLRQVRGLDKTAIARVLNIAEPTAVHYIKSSMCNLKKIVYERLEMKRA